MRDYNSKQAQKLLRGIYDANVDDSIVNANGDWIELLKETQRYEALRPCELSVSKNVYKQSLKRWLKADAQIKDLVYRYNMYGAEPVQVAGNDAPDLNLKKIVFTT